MYLVSPKSLDDGDYRYGGEKRNTAKPVVSPVWPYRNSPRSPTIFAIRETTGRNCAADLKLDRGSASKETSGAYVHGMSRTHYQLRIQRGKFANLSPRRRVCRCVEGFERNRDVSPFGFSNDLALNSRNAESTRAPRFQVQACVCGRVNPRLLIKPIRRTTLCRGRVRSLRSW